jgi:orotate phosphoribosyltransferase-like protein
MIEYFTRCRDDILQRAKLTCFEELTVFHLLSPYMGKKGYKNGIGAMSAEARMAASAKGYDNGLGAMSVEENKMRRGIAWEKKYAEFKRCVGMPETGTPLHNWQKNQLGNTHVVSLNAKIREEQENEGSTIWSERRLKLANCVEQKNREKIGNAWEKKYAEFKRCVGMPKKGTPLYNWKQNQLGNTHVVSLNAKIREENAENEGSTIWSERRVKLSDCIEQKRSE